VNGYNAKIQFGFERANFKGIITQNAALPGGVSVDGSKATVDVIRLQAQVAF